MYTNFLVKNLRTHKLTSRRKSCIDLVHAILVCTSLIIASIECTCQVKTLTILITSNIGAHVNSVDQSIQDFLNINTTLLDNDFAKLIFCLHAATFRKN